MIPLEFKTVSIQNGEHTNIYINIEWLKDKIQEMSIDDDDRFTRGYNSALSDLIEILEKEE